MSDDPPETLATRREVPEPHRGQDDQPVPDVFITRHDVVHGTRRDTVVDSTPSESANEGEATIALPAGLRERYSIVRQFPDPGAEADVALVRSSDGEELVIKLYRLGVRADRDVWRRLSTLSSAHVVRIHETGEAGNRDYECMEFLPGGNLLTLMRDGAPVLSTTARTVVEQVTAALDALHGAGIVHCDLKPENILIRSCGSHDLGTPLDLVLTDFGLSRAPEQSVVAASRSGTLAYLAPELLLRSGAQSSKARDWWALGVVVRELLTAERPFSHMSEPGVEWSVLMSGLDLSQIEDRRLRLLCQGLLTRNPANRWGSEQVRSWLGGHDPDVIEDEAPQAAERDGVRPLAFDGARHYDRRSLAQAFLTSWDDATRRFLVGLARGDNPSQAWRNLRNWLEQFDDPSSTDAESLVTLIDDRLLADLKPDVKMLYLVQWLDPEQPPVYRGRSMDCQSLAGLARRAASSDDPDHTNAARIVRDLQEQDLLLILADAPGGEKLRRVHELWTSSRAHARTRIQELLTCVPPPRPTVNAEWLSAILLLVAAEPTTPSIPTQMRAAAVATVPDRVDWFERMQHEACTGAVDDLAVIMAAPRAAEDAHAAIVEIERVTAERLARREAWARSESLRREGAGRARARAVGYVVVVGAVMTLDILIFASMKPPGSQVAVASLVGGMVLAALALTELSLAGHAAGQYGHFAPLSRGSGGLSRIGGGIDTAGRGCLSVIVVLVLGSLAVSNPVLFFLLILVVHLFTWWRRRSTWNRAYDVERTRLMGSTADER